MLVSTFNAVLNNQRGTALLFSLIMLVIMSMIGILSLSLSDTEIDISGNYLTARDAFYAADRAATYVGADTDMFTLNSTEVLDLTDVNQPHVANIQVGNSGLDPNNPSRATGLGVGPPPAAFKPGEGSDAGLFQAHYLLVEVTGVAPVGAANPSRASIESQIAVIVPK